MRRVLYAMVWAGLWLPLTHALNLPALQGDISGQLVLQGFGEVPPLDWRVRAGPLNPDSAGNRLRATITAPGLALELELNVPTNDEAMHWRVVKGEVDLGHWWRPLAAKAGLTALPGDFMLSGTVILSGEGTLKGTDPAGVITARLVDARAGSVEQNWQLTGIGLTAQVELTPEGPVVQSVQLRAVEAMVADVQLSDLRLDAAGDPQRRLVIETARLDVLGGRLSLRPFTLNPLKPAIDTTVDLEGVALSALAQFVPEALSEASGRVSGRVAVRWDAANGFQSGAGALTVSPESPASIRLAAAPGFLTDHVPERIAWLPSVFGKLADRLAVENPAYDTLRAIELGEMPLQVEKLRIELYPDGPDGVRSAVAEVVARPATGHAVERVSFTVTVAGPLDEVLRLGASDQAKIRFNTKP